MDHLSAFTESNRESNELAGALEAPLADLELSVRARNCLDGADLRTLRDLVSLTENEVMNLNAGAIPSPGNLHHVQT